MLSQFILLLILLLSPNILLCQDISGDFAKSKALYNKAIQDCKEQLKKYPDSETLHFQLGEMYEFSKINDLAIKEYEKVLDLNKSNIKASYLLGKLYLWNDSESEEGVDLLKKVAIKLNNKEQAEKEGVDLFELYEALGDSYSYSETYEEAIEAYKNALLIKNDPTIHYEIANCYYWNNDISTAESEYRAAISLDPGMVNAYLELGRLLCNKKNYNEAVSQLSEVIRIDPNRSQAYVLLGKTYLESNNKEKALNAFRKAFQFSDNKGEYTGYNLGKLYFEIGLYAEAIFPLETALVYKPKNREYQQLLAKSYLKNTEYKELLELLDRILPKYKILLGLMLLSPLCVMSLINLMGKKMVKTLSSDLELRIIQFNGFRKSVNTLIYMSFIVTINCLLFAVSFLLQIFGFSSAFYGLLFILIAHMLMLSVFFKYDKIARNYTASLLEYLRFNLLLIALLTAPYWVLIPNNQIVMKYGPLLLLSVSFFYNACFGYIVKVLTRARSFIFEESHKILSDKSIGFNKVRDILIVNTGNLKIANAVSVGILPGCKHIIIFSSLLNILSSKELSSILYHELAHVELGHNWKRFWNQALLLLFCQLILSTFFSKNYIAYFWLLIYLFLHYALFSGLYKKQELQADLAAADKISPEIVISSLQRMHNELYLPVYFGSSSHPTLYERIINLKLVQDKKKKYSSIVDELSTKCEH